MMADNREPCGTQMSIRQQGPHPPHELIDGRSKKITVKSRLLLRAPETRKGIGTTANNEPQQKNSARCSQHVSEPNDQSKTGPMDCSNLRAA